MLISQKFFLIEKMGSLEFSSSYLKSRKKKPSKDRLRDGKKIASTTLETWQLGCFDGKEMQQQQKKRTSKQF